MSSSKNIYKILFVTQGKVYEIYARSVGHGELFGFVEVEELGQQLRHQAHILRELDVGDAHLGAAGIGLATMVIGLMVMIYLWVVVPSPQSEGMASLGLVGTLKRQFGAVWKSIFLIWLVMVLRAVVGQSFMTFMPVLLVSRGYSATLIDP